MLDGFSSPVQGDVFSENEPVGPVCDVSELRPDAMAVRLNEQFIVREDKGFAWRKLFGPANRLITMRQIARHRARDSRSIAGIQGRCNEDKNKC